MKLLNRLFCTVCISLLCVCGVFAESQKGRHAPSVAVVGSGSVAGVPDTIQFQVGITTSNKSAAVALDENSDVSAQLRKVLLGHGVAERQMKTAQFDVSPVYERATGNEQPRLTGYRVTHSLSVSYTELDNAGALLDALIKAGSNVLHGVRFSVSEPQTLLTQARKLAVDDAIARATTLAEAAGRKLGPIRRIVEGNVPSGGPRFDGAMEMRTMSAVPIATGEQTFSVDVTIVFALD